MIIETPRCNVSASHTWLTPAVTAAALVLALLAAPNLRAATYYWDSNDATPGFGTANGTWAAPTTNDATQGWSTSSNGTSAMSGTTTTNSADAVNFGTATNQLGSGTINVSGDVSANTLTFVGSSSSLTLSGGNITLNGGITATNSANTSAITETISSNVNLGASQTWTVNNGGSVGTTNLEVSGPVTGGSFGLTKTGNGTLTLSGAGNSWNGTTQIQTGTVNLSGSLTTNGTFQPGHSSSGSVLNITGNLTLTKSADPRNFQVAQGNGHSGTVNVSGAGILNLTGMMLGENFGGNGTLNISGGTVTNSGATWFSGRDCTITVTGGNFNAGTNGLELGGGAGNTTSTINLSGTGLFNVGGLVLGRGNSAGNTATTIINLGDGTTGGNLATTGFSYLNGASFNSNTINFNGGTLTAKSNFNINSGNHTTVVKSGGAFIDTGIFSMTISSNLTDGGGGGGLTKNGSGTLTLSGEGNTYTGTTTVNGGTLALGANNSLGAIAGSGALNLSSFNLTTTAASNTTFSGIISGTGGSLTKNGAGTLTLSGANSYTGATTVNGGGLTTTGANMLSDSAAVTVGSGASLTLGGSDTVATIAGAGSISTGANTLTVSSSNNADFSGTITGTTGGFTKAGTGTQTLSGTGNSWNGNTAVSAGTLALSGSLTSNANVAVGSASGAALNITGNLTQTKTSGGPRGFQLAAGAGTTGTVNVSGSGILNIGTGMMLGDNGGGNGTFNVSGGTVINSGETWFAGPNSTFNVSGGSYTATPGWTYLGGGGSNNSTTTSTLTVNGTGTYTASTIDFGRGSTNATSIINLGDGSAGGNLSVSGLSYVQGPSPTINFNGGTLNVRSSISMITQAATVVKSGGAIFDVDASRTFTITNNLTTDGTGGGLTKNGAGTLTLSGAGNNYTGTTTLNAGTLSLGAANVIGDSSAVAVNGGTFDLGTNAETLHSLNMSGGTLLRGGETLTLNNASSITGGTVVLSSQASSRINTTGLLTLGSASMNYTSTSGSNGTNILVLGGDIAVNPASTFNFIDSGGAAGNPNINLNNATRVFDVGTGASLNVGWDIRSSTASAGAITKNGSGTLTLNGSASHSGTTTLNEGQLNINTATAIGSGTLAINGGTINNTSAAALTLSNNNVQRWNGDFAFGGTRDLNLGTGAVTMNATRTVTVNGGNLTVGGAIAGSGFGLTKEGLGTMILSGANTYNGSTTVNAGTLKLGGGSDRLADGTSLVINSGGTFDIAGFSDTIAGLSGSGSLVLSNLGSLTIGTMAADTTFSGLISGSGTLDKRGGTGKFITLTNDSNSFTGNLSLANGGTGFYVTSIGNIGQNSAAGAGQRIIWNSNPQLWYIGTTNSSSNRTLEFTGANSGLIGNNGTGTLSFTGNFVNTGSGAKIFYLDGNNTGSNLLGVNLVDNGNSTLNLTKQGTGKWIVSGNNTNTGGTSLKDGELSLGHKNALGTGTLFYDNAGGTPNAILTANTNLTGANAVSNNITLSAAGTKTIGGSNDLELSGIISGSGLGFTKNGSGTLILSGANTYTGATTITAGTLQIGGGGTTGSLSTSSAITNNANLAFNRTNTLTQGTDFNSVISGTGNVTQAGTGTTVLNGTNTYTGATTITAGTLSIAAITNGSVAGALGNSTTAAGNLVFSGGELAYTGSNGSTNRNFTLAAGTSSTINVTQSATSLTLSGTAASTNGSLTKAGSGTLILSGANSHSGTTTISAGTLTLQAANALGTSTLAQSSGSSLLLIDTTGTISNSMSVYNVRASQSATLGGAITVNNAVWDVDSGDTLTISGGIGGTGGVTKNGTGTLVLSGSNTYSGATVVNAGTLNASHANALGTNASVTVNGGSLLVSADDAINSKNVILASTATGNGTAASLVFSGTYNGTAGSLTLNQNSIIDLGTGSVVVHFTDMVMGLTNTLSIYNWTGTTLWGGGDGNNTDQFYIDRTLTGGELNRISFYSGIDNSSFVGTAYQLTGGSFANEVIPVPEPETYATALLLLLGLGFCARREFKRRRLTN